MMRKMVWTSIITMLVSIIILGYACYVLYKSLANVSEMESELERRDNAEPEHINNTVHATASENSQRVEIQG